MKLFLIGLLGSGKSVLGKELAQLLRLTFIDLDEVLMTQEQMEVSEIFRDKGEAAFRRMEAAALREQSRKKEFVMATGGGTPCFHDSMTFINQTGISVFLDTPIPEIVKRLQGEQLARRPMLANVPGDQLQPTLENLLQERLEFYCKAHHHVRGAAISAQEVLNLLQVRK